MAALWMLSYLPNLKSSKAPSPLRFAGALQMAIEIINRHRRKISAKQWRDFGKEALAAIGTEERDATIVFVSDATIKKLNSRFRAKNYATDVLSFPSQPERFEAQGSANLGEVVISWDRAAAQAKQNKLTVTNEVRQLILHGLLHLCGYDHETDNGEMNRLELKLRKRLRI